MTPTTLRVFGPAKYLTDNMRLHWRPKADLIASWRMASLAAHRTLLISDPWAAVGRARLDVVVIWPDSRRRDVENYRPTIKAVIDGAVTGRGKIKGAGMLPDDDSYCLPETPLTHEVRPGSKPTLLLTWTPLTEENR